MDVRLGLDFGTHQTKACLNYMEGNQPEVYEFFLFDPEDESSFFFPSKVGVKKDQTLVFGDYSKDFIQKEYKYFKIASAEDDAFRGISGLDSSDIKYDETRYEGVTPEVLSILYLAWVIGYIKEEFSTKISSGKDPKKGLLGRFMKKKSSKIEIDYHIQIGIPTEWSKKRNQWRRRKFEQILFLATQLLEKLNTYEQLKEIKLPELKYRIQKLYQELQLKTKKKSWKEIIREHELSVFPETAAGLTCLVKEKNLDPKYYSAIDIGGGSSDISYFRVTHDRKIEYLASESLLIASNDLFNRYSRFQETIPNSTEQAQIYLEDIQQNNRLKLDKDEKYRESFESTFLDLNDRFKKIYNSRVYQRFRKEIANKKFDDHDCYVYGGGSLVHKPKKNPYKLFEKILIHDNGTPNSLTMTRTYANVNMLGRITLPFDVRPRSWKKYRPLLLVPLGLSNVQPDQNYDWSNRYYKPGEQVVKLDIEDLGLYDVFKRKWV